MSTRFPNIINKLKKDIKGTSRHVQSIYNKSASTATRVSSANTVNKAKRTLWPSAEVISIFKRPQQSTTENVDRSRLISQGSSFESCQPMSNSSDIHSLVSFSTRPIPEPGLTDNGKHSFVDRIITAIGKSLDYPFKSKQRIFRLKRTVNPLHVPTSTVELDQLFQQQRDLRMRDVSPKPREPQLMSGFICRVGNCAECQLAEEEIDVFRVSKNAPQLDPVRISEFTVEPPIAIDEDITPTAVRFSVDSGTDASIFKGDIAPTTSRFTKAATQALGNSSTGICLTTITNETDSSYEHNWTGSSTEDLDDPNFKYFQHGMEAQIVTLVRATAQYVNIRDNKKPRGPTTETKTVESLDDCETLSIYDKFSPFEMNMVMDTLIERPAISQVAVGSSEKVDYQRAVPQKQLDRQTSRLLYSCRPSYETACETLSSVTDENQSPTPFLEKPLGQIEDDVHRIEFLLGTPVEDGATTEDLSVYFQPIDVKVRPRLFLDLRPTRGFYTTLLGHISNGIRDKPSHFAPKSIHSATPTELNLTKSLEFSEPAAYVAASVRGVRKSRFQLVTFDQFPFEVLEGLIRAAVFGDEQCQELVREIHDDCMHRLTSYTLKVRRQIRLGYMMMDLYCLAYTRFTTWDVADGIRKYFFPTATDGSRLEDKVLASFVHHAVRSGHLPKSSANQILLLLTACESDYESEVERAVLEDRELFGPDGFIYTNNGRVIDRPQDISLYDELIHEEDLKDAPKTVAQAHKRVISSVYELQKYIAGDQRPGAFGSDTGNEYYQGFSHSGPIDDALVSLGNTQLLPSPEHREGTDFSHST